MRFALQTDYALRTLILLAARPGRTQVQAIADFYGISKDHVAKVVQQLGRLGYIRTLRGVGGGIELARSPADVSVGEVVLAFEGNLHLLECVGTENVCVIQRGCRLKNVLAEAERLMVDYLRGVTLADLLPARPQLTELTAVAMFAADPPLPVADITTETP